MRRHSAECEIYWGDTSAEIYSAEVYGKMSVKTRLEMVKAKQYVEPGDIVVLTAGLPAPMGSYSYAGNSGSNMMRIAVIE